MEKNNLGSDEQIYHDILKKICPRLDALSSKSYSRYVKTFCKAVGIIPAIDEDVKRILSEKVRFVGGKFKTIKHGNQNIIEKINPYEIKFSDMIYVHQRKADIIEDITPYGALEIDVNALYTKLSKANLILYGKSSNKEEVILFLILWCMLDYPEITHELEGAFSIEEKEKALDGFLRVFKKFGVTIPTFVFDEYEDIIFVAWPLLLESFTFSDELFKMDEKDARRVVLAYMLMGSKVKGQALYDKLKEKAIKEAERSLKASKNTTYNWLTLLSQIYSIKYLEKIHDWEGKILKPVPDLQKIWAIPRKTWADKWNLIAAIDKKI